MQHAYHDGHVYGDDYDTIADGGGGDDDDRGHAIDNDGDDDRCDADRVDSDYDIEDVQPQI